MMIELIFLFFSILKHKIVGGVEAVAVLQPIPIDDIMFLVRLNHSVNDGYVSIANHFSISVILFFDLQTTNHLGQLTIADDQGNAGDINPYVGDYYFPKVKGYSSHRNNYQMPEDQAT